MNEKETNQLITEKSPGQKRDLPGIIKYILLVFLIILLILEIGSGEFRELGRIAWLLILIKLILIFGLIILIRIQRKLVADLTGPTGCTEEEPDSIKGILFVRVTGTAKGFAAAGYTIEVRKVGFSTPIPDIVIYPGGTPGGIPPVINGELGRINTTGLDDGAYEIKLIVHPTGPGAPATDTIIFNLLKAMVFISRVGNIPVISQTPNPNNPNPFDPNAEICLDFAAGPPEDYRPVSIGGSITIHGAAYIYECPGRKIARYGIRYARVISAGSEPAQPATDASIPGLWPAANQAVLLEYTIPEHYRPWTKIGLAPRELTNRWRTFNHLGIIRYKLWPEKWNTGNLSGRYSLLLYAEDTTAGPHRYLDIQHVWIDNKPIKGQITGIAEVKPCDVYHLNDFTGKSIKITGLAWDPLIDDNFPDSSPNDNFGGYSLHIYKQGVSTPYEIITSNSRVPAAKTGPSGFPAVADAGILASFRIASVLDADNPSPPSGVPADIKIPRGEGCAYYFELHVWDKSYLGDSGAHHHRWSRWPICVDNNIK